MGIFDKAKEQAEKLMEEHGDKVEQGSDAAFDRVAAEANERTEGRYDEHIDRARDLADSHVGIDGPGVPDTAGAAAGPTQATTSGAGPAPAAGQAEPSAEPDAGLTDSAGASESAAAPTYPEFAGEPGANGGLSSDADPVNGLSEDLGLAPGATDAVDPGQDNGLNS
jgi:hypothetical protein